MIDMTVKSLISVVLCLFSQFVFSNTFQSDDYERHFIEQIESINKTLDARQKEFKESPIKLVSYVDKQLIPMWSSEKTMRGLLSGKNWKTLSDEQKKELSKVFDDTLQRYVQEGFKSYDGQEIEFVKLKLHPKKPRGLLTVKVIPNLLPSFHIHLKVEHKDQNWKIYDVMVQGVSYISLKKNEVRGIFNKGGVRSVLKEFIAKNQGFIPSGAFSADL